MTSADAVLRGGASTISVAKTPSAARSRWPRPRPLPPAPGTLTLNGNVNDVTFPLTVATGTAGDLIINGDLAGTGTVTKGTSAAEHRHLDPEQQHQQLHRQTVLNGGTLAVNGLIPATNLLTVNGGSLVGNGSANSIDNLAPTSPNTAIISAAPTARPALSIRARSR